MRPRRGLTGSRLAAPALSVVVALVIVLSGAAPVHAADGIRLQVDATYTADPDDGVIRVRMDIRATNTTPNRVEQTATGTLTTRYFFNELRFAIQEDARNVRATSAGSTLRATSSPDDGHRLLTVRMPNLFTGSTRRIRVDFDIAGGAPRSDSDTRVGEAFTTFVAWAWGDPARSSVSIVLPPGFVDDGYGEDVRQTTAEDTITFTSGSIDDPTDWYRVVIADREASLTDERIDPSGYEIAIRGWPEDAAWRDEVADVLDAGVPVLVERVGLAWPVSGTLEVTEVHSPLLEGYAGFYDPSEDAITISEDLDTLTILHEASHAWFNDDLVRDRWISEGLAEYFSAAVAEELRLDVEDRPTTRTNAEGAFPLNAWPPPARIDDDEQHEAELFGYEASYTVMGRIVDEIGEDGLRTVLAAMDAGRNPYTGDGRPDEIGARPDWRLFLDHVSAVAEDGDVDDLFLAWVVTDDQRPRMGERRETRATYAALEARAGTWAVPDGVRYQMAHWRFSDADARMADAMDVVELRDDLAEAASELSVSMPVDLEAPFEQAVSKDDLAAIGTILDDRLAAVEVVANARDALAAERSVLASIGLLGATPAAGYVSGRVALTQGDTEGAISGAEASVAMLAGAEAMGQERVLIAVITILVVLAVVLLLDTVIRRRRRKRRSTGSTITPAAVVEAEAPLPD